MNIELNNMSRKERCSNCFKSVLGLFIIRQKPNRTLERKAFYCSNCNIILRDTEVCYKVINYKPKSE